MYDDSARPWPTWANWYKMLAGGSTMPLAPTTNAAQLPTLETFRLEPGGDGFNPSIAVHAGRLMAIIRTASNGRTTNVLGEIKDRRLVGARRVTDPRGFHSKWGFEDCRLFSLDGALHVSATFGEIGATVGYAKAKMAVLQINPNGDFVSVHPQLSGNHEKNWAPIIDQYDGKSRLRFVYSTRPLAVVSFDLSSMIVGQIPVRSPEDGGTIRGGSQVIRYKDGWLTVAHEADSTKTYSHRFVSFDQEFTTARVGRPFYFQKRGIEFAAGLAEFGGRLLVSYGVDDKRAFVSHVDEATVEEFLEPEPGAPK